MKYGYGRIQYSIGDPGILVRGGRPQSAGYFLFFGRRGAPIFAISPELGLSTRKNHACDSSKKQVQGTKPGLDTFNSR
jgi:hypothetical protein